MRLIHAASLRLERFDDDSKIPPYAILSHTWGGQEISLQQFQDTYADDEPTRTRIRSMSGYSKIVKTCEQALIDDYAYAWVDTCCIDKQSSSELSEAINSMYRWYAKAKICYAFLDDLKPRSQLSNKAGPEAIQLDLQDEQHLGTSRWFSRGWTLQELIAPVDVMFYASDWTFIGARSVLHGRLSRITGIERAVLSRVKTVDQFSVAKRMSWAAKRKTTRLEDMAYSLMGLFDVNMPLLYGEGDKAFTRLQEEILKESDDQSLFTWTPVTTRPRTTGMRGPQALGISVFAKHPQDFAEAKDIYPLVPQGEPTTVTNKGVRIDLPIIQVKQNVLLEQDNLFLAVLYCGYGEDDRQHPAIILRSISSETGAHEYVRHETAGIFTINSNEVFSSDMRQIYLSKQPNRWLRKRAQFEMGPRIKLLDRGRIRQLRLFEYTEHGTGAAQHEDLSTLVASVSRQSNGSRTSLTSARDGLLSRLSLSRGSTTHSLP